MFLSKLTMRTSSRDSRFTINGGSRAVVLRCDSCHSVLALGLMLVLAQVFLPGSVRAQDGRPRSPVADAFVLDPTASPGEVRFVVESGGMTAWLTPQALVLRVVEPRAAHVGRTDPRSSADHEASVGQPVQAVDIFLRFVGASAAVRLEGALPLPGRRAFYLGADPAGWVPNAQAFSEVTYRDLYPGIDLRLTTTPEGLEYDVIVAPGADLAAFQVQLQGADELHADAAGRLLAHTPLGVLTQYIPAAWQQGLASARDPIAATFVIAGDRFGLAVEGRDTTRTLVVDPGLLFASYLGGLVADTGTSIAIDPTGASYVIGHTMSIDFPTVPGPIVLAGGADAFVSKVDPTGAMLVYSVVLGGSEDDMVWKIDVDDAGAAYVGGETLSDDWPVTPGAYSTTFSGGTSDALVFKLDPTGMMDWSTYLGGAMGIYDFVNALIVDDAGSVLVTGGTYSADFPVTLLAFDTFHGGDSDIFVSRLDPTGSTLLWSTFLGAASDDRAFGIDVDEMAVSVAGYTESFAYPVTVGAFGPIYGGMGDGCVTKLTLDGSMVIASTFVGSGGFESCNELDIDWLGSVFVTGVTSSATYPVTFGAVDTTFNGVFDVTVTNLTPLLDGVYYSTYLGGSDDDTGLDIAVDVCGRPSVTGWTYSDDFPVTPGAFQPALDGDVDAFVAQCDFLGTIYNYGSYLGGPTSDWGNGIVVDEALRSYLCGSTISAGFPTTLGAFDPDYNLAGDAWFGKVEFPWLNEFASLITVTEPRLIGDGSLAPLSDLTVTLMDAVPSSLAALFLGLTRIDVPFKGGVIVPSPDITLILTTSAGGTIVLATTWPAGIPAGFMIYLHCWIADPSGPAGAQASNALSATVP